MASEMKTAVRRSQPIVTARIFAIARFTQPMITQLIGMPR
jgi:hypothetical protein